MSVKDLTLSGGTRLHRTAVHEVSGVPLVTVITAVMNGAGTVKGCIESVLRQDYPNIEHIVLDGGSTDGTVDVLRRYDDRIALWRSEPDRGIYDAWNKGLVEARGEWICFLGADDEFLPGAVRAYMALAANNPQAEYLSSKVKVLHASGYARILGSPWTWRKFSKAMCTLHVGSMHRRSLFDSLGRYDTSYRIVADYEFLLRARDRLNTAYMPVITSMMRAGGMSGSRKALEETARAKVETGGRSRVLAIVELHIAKAKFLLRPLRSGLGGMVARRFTAVRPTAKPFVDRSELYK
jgi:glycosyltransferase involved in cell wall biosynthesis